SGCVRITRCSLSRVRVDSSPACYTRASTAVVRSAVAQDISGGGSMTAITPAVATAIATPRQALTDDTLGMDATALRHSVLEHLEYTLAELPRHVDSEWEPYLALALTVRDRLVQRW